MCQVEVVENQLAVVLHCRRRQEMKLAFSPRRAIPPQLWQAVWGVRWPLRLITNEYLACDWKKD